MKKFPKKLYVVREQDGEASYLVANEDPGSFVEVGVAVEAAEYALVRPGVIIEAEVKVS